jgi:hypothetical protein
MNAGSCLCGALRYEVDVGGSVLTHCHCRTCRKHHGAPFASFVAVGLNSFRWLSGENQLITFGTPLRPRCACEVCGAVAPVRVADEYLVPAGNLSGELDVREARHVCVAAKPAWHRIGDRLPQFAGGVADWACEPGAPPAPAADGPIPGSCSCGDVTFDVTGEPARWMQCHCSRCRRARSAAHGSNTFYPTAQFTWRTGKDKLRSFTPPDAKRFAATFCVRCGGGAPVERENVPFVLIPAALFDAELPKRPDAHIHMASKSTWYTFVDDLPQFAELPS